LLCLVIAVLGCQNAAERFHQLQRVYETLADEDKRKLYDETGRAWDDDEADEFTGKSFEQLYAYFRSIYKPLDAEDIAAYESKYRGGDDETDDLVEHFVRFGGSMDAVISYVPYSSEADLHRFVRIIDAKITEGVLQPSAQYNASRKRLLKRASKIDQIAVSTAAAPCALEADAPLAPSDGAAAKRRRKNAGSNTASLELAIAKRNQDRGAKLDGFFDQLAAKYGSSGKRKASSKAGSKAKGPGHSSSRKHS